MKSVSILLTILPLSVTICNATSILIDNSTRNGGFETNTNTTYADMAEWFNNPGAQTTAVRNSSAETGSYAGVVSAASNPTIDTGKVLTADDAFTLNFGYRDNIAGGNPLIHWQLFYFSNEGDLGFTPLGNTNRVVLATNSVTASSTTYAKSSFSPTATPSSDPGIGSTVYLRFYRTAADGQFPLIDNVNLSVVPEPSSALLGIASLLALSWRRSR